jgi:anti-anti-sigma factor
MTAAPIRPLRLRFPSSPAVLAVVRVAIGKFCDVLGFDCPTISGIVLSVDEALTNIIRHAYKGDENHGIEVELSAREGGGLRVSLRDYGPGLRTDQLPVRPAEVLTPGGLGLQIIRHYMDRVDYRPAQGGGTLLVMEKDMTPDNERKENMNPKPPQSSIRSVRKVGPDTVVEAVGDIDLRSSQDFQQALLAVAEEKPRRIVVDLSAVPYMDSSGVASLVKLLSRARKVGATLHLAGLNERVRSIFEITRLERVFDIRSTAQEALEAP